MRARWIGVWGAALAVLSTAPEARASGLYLGDIGTRGMARGGAFIARPDSLLAIHYNPAGLSLLRGLHLELSGTMVDLNALFERTCPCAPPELENASAIDQGLEAQFRNTESRSTGQVYIPFFGVSYGLPFKNLTIAFAGYGPHGAATKFGELGVSPSGGEAFMEAARARPARYSVLQTDPIEVNLALAAGMEIIPQVRIGAGIMTYMLGLKQTRHAWVNADVDQNPEDPAFDVPLTLSFMSKPALTWMVGLSVDVHPNLSLGSSLRWSRRVKTKGTLDAELPNVLLDPMTGEGLNGSKIVGRDVEVALSLAPVWRLGVEYRLPDRLWLEAAVVYEGWSVQEDIQIDTQDIKVNVFGQEQPLADFSIPRNWVDTFSLRLGGEYVAIEELLTVRAGYFYEPSAVPPKYLEPGQIDRPKHGFSAGVGLDALGFQFDLAGSFIYFRPIMVENSRVLEVGPLTAPLGTNERITTVGNGLYQGRVFMMSASIARSFDL